MRVTLYHAEHAWLGQSGFASGVLIEVTDGRFTRVTPDSPPAGTRLPGLVLPGLANAHSHAFHRALRGRTHAGRGSFWTWRDQMYKIATRLDPDEERRQRAKRKRGLKAKVFACLPCRMPKKVCRQCCAAARAAGSV